MCVCVCVGTRYIQLLLYYVHNAYRYLHCAADAAAANDRNYTYARMMYTYYVRFGGKRAANGGLATPKLFMLCENNKK